MLNGEVIWKARGTLVYLKSSMIKVKGRERTFK